MGAQVCRPRYRSTGSFLVEGIEGLVVSVAVLLTWFVSKRWLANLGSVSSERTREWPGDQRMLRTIRRLGEASDEQATSAGYALDQ